MIGLQAFGEKEVILQDIGMVVKRATGTIGDPNIFGYFFEMLIPLSFCHVHRRTPFSRQVLVSLRLLFRMRGNLYTLREAPG